MHTFEVYNLIGLETSVPQQDNDYTVDEKLTNGQSKKVMENFIGVNLGIITRDTVFQKALRTVLKR